MNFEGREVCPPDVSEETYGSGAKAVPGCRYTCAQLEPTNSVFKTMMPFNLLDGNNLKTEKV